MPWNVTVRKRGWSYTALIPYETPQYGNLANLSVLNLVIFRRSVVIPGEIHKNDKLHL